MCNSYKGHYQVVFSTYARGTYMAPTYINADRCAVLGEGSNAQALLTAKQAAVVPFFWFVVSNTIACDKMLDTLTGTLTVTTLV